ncbi:CHASE2 domain-containing protein [Halofilum ochraceum]|uniref:CHASE2 domain-containing protein n=1 Tax=Halofilum ochraceum TaxID=1611323 RepID=UPI0008DACCD6|nr:adenylate/guanylate cyclase domain-containing protein [Halofilum ochraceum]
MSTQRYIRIGISLLLIVPFLLHATGVLRLGFLEQLENMAYDARLQLTLPGTVDERVVIVAIDEASLNEVGRWPWSRDVLARMVDRLYDHYNADTVGFDVVFAERDESSGLQILQRLADGSLSDNPDFLEAYRRLAPKLDRDRTFARALQDRNTVLGFFFRNSVDPESDESVGMLPPALDASGADGLEQLPILTPQGYGANLPVLQEAAASGGFFDNPLVGRDGVFRRVPLIQAYEGDLYGLLAFETARAALDWPEVELEVAREGNGYQAVESVRMGSREIPVDEQGAVLVPYRGPQHSFPYVSAADILNGTADPAVLEDRIVLVGATAAGLLDLRSTPVQNVYPGVEVHANIVSGILDERIKRRPAYLLGYEFIILALVGIGLTALLPLLPPLWLSAAITGITALLLATNVMAWNGANLVLPLASPLVLVALLFIFHVAWGFFVETRGKRQLAKLFGQYIPPELVEEMDKAPEEVSLAGESREMTVLFSDVRGFTGISENLEPSELTRLMNAFLTPMTRVIHQHRGTIDKYMGDAIMAFWGAPLADPDHARHALYAAWEMQQTMKDLQPQFEREGWPALEVGIGLNSGVMNVGNMGSEFRMAYTALGDAVNLGSRLEGLTRTYGVDMIVSETTRHAVPEFEFRELDVVRVKGKDRPVAIYEPIGPIDEVERETRKAIKRYHAALEKYRQRDWDDAEREIFSLSREYPDDTVYAMYLDRIMHFRNHPPPDDWDGVFTHQTK